MRNKTVRCAKAMLTQRSEKSKPIGQVGQCPEGYIGVYSRVFVDSSRHCP